MNEYIWDRDYEKAKEFLIKTNNQFGKYINWLPTRFENRKVGPCGTKYKDEEDNLVKIWEDSNSNQIVAITILKSSGVNWIQIHPDFRFFEEDLVKFIESELLKLHLDHNKKCLCNFNVLAKDDIRKSVLKKLGYKFNTIEAFLRIRPKSTKIIPYQITEGYSIRGINPKSDFIQYKEVMGSVFKHCGQMTKELFDIYTSADFYKPNLDMIAVDSKGLFAAFATFRYEPYTKIVELEPVGTHPNHRKKGLASAVIIEGIKRLEEIGYKDLVIQGAANTPGANSLYDKLGFTEKEEIEVWQREL